MKVRFHPDAERELEEAFDFYEETETGLGLRFAREIQRGIELIDGFPGSWPDFSASTKRFLVKKFPYGIIYSVYDDTIFILAIMHLRRKPGYWQERN